MLIQTENSKIITDFLRKDLIINLNILGILNNQPEAKIYVDDVINPEGIWVNNGYFNYIYSKNEKFVNEVLESFDVPGEYGFSGVEKSIADRFNERFNVVWNNSCDLYYLPKENLDLSLIKNPVKMIDIKDAETIDSFYTFRDEGSFNKIQEDILLRPSTGIYIDGELVCWLLTHDDNSLGIMYTKEQFRNRGYAVDLTVDLSAKHFNKNLIPFLHIEKNNNMSPGLAKKCGFIKFADIEWFGITVK